jgi:thioredoxin-related protein
MFPVPKHHVMQACGGMQENLHTILNLTLDRSSCAYCRDLKRDEFGVKEKITSMLGSKCR